MRTIQERFKYRQQLYDIQAWRRISRFPTPRLSAPQASQTAPTLLKILPASESRPIYEGDIPFFSHYTFLMLSFFTSLSYTSINVKCRRARAIFGREKKSWRFTPCSRWVDATPRKITYPEPTESLEARAGFRFRRARTFSIFECNVRYESSGAGLATIQVLTQLL